MQLILEKAEVVNLEADIMQIGLSIGDNLYLRFDEENSCQVYYTPKQSWLSNLIFKRKMRRLGQLTESDTAYLLRSFNAASKARIRVVDAIPKHLSAENKDSVFISTWIKVNWLNNFGFDQFTKTERGIVHVSFTYTVTFGLKNDDRGVVK